MTRQSKTLLSTLTSIALALVVSTGGGCSTAMLTGGLIKDSGADAEENNEPDASDAAGGTSGFSSGDGALASGGGFTGCMPLANPTAAGCTVSFKNDILEKKMGAAGTWGCAASGCHDAQGGVAPKIDVTDPLTTYTNLYNSGSGSAPYINPCSTDPTKSEIIGNLSNPSTAGDHMPKGNTSLPPQADIDDLVKLWVECGAPLN